jgi:hypothetical protein
MLADGRWQDLDLPSFETGEADRIRAQHPRDPGADLLPLGRPQEALDK